MSYKKSKKNIINKDMTTVLRERRQSQRLQSQLPIVTKNFNQIEKININEYMSWDEIIKNTHKLLVIR